MSPQEFTNTINKCNNVNNLTFARSDILTQMPQRMCFLAACDYRLLSFCLSPRDTKSKSPSVSKCRDLLTRNLSELPIYVTSRIPSAEVIFPINLSSTSAIGQATKEVFSWSINQHF